MNRAGHETANCFVGTEVEHSPAFGHKTLFVVGVQDPVMILELARANGCTHDIGKIIGTYTPSH